MINYKIIESSISHFKGIELPFDFSSNETGDEIFVLGLKMTINQLGQEIIGLSNSENILVFQKLS